MKKILLVTNREYWKKNNGANLRIENLIKNLEKDFDLRVVYLGDEKILNLKRFRKNKVYSRLKINNFFKKILKNFIKLILKKDMLKKMLKDKKLEYYNDKKDLKFYKEIIKKENPKIIIYEYIYFSYLLKETSNNIYKVIDTHDIQSERKKEFTKNKLKGVLDINFEEEVEILNKYNLILTINDRDKKIIEPFLHKKILTVLYPSKIKKLDKKLEKEKKMKIGFIGGDAQPNILGIIKFIDEVILTLKENENIELNIYGKVCNFLNNYKQNSKINIHGFTNDLEIPYKENDIMINPMTFGSGLKIKSIEALCYGKCLITTDVGAQGLNMLREGFIVENDFKKQKEMILKLYNSNDLITYYENIIFELVKNTFSEQKIYKNLIKELKEVK